MNESAIERTEAAAWWVAGILGILALVYAGVMAWLVLSTMNWDLLWGNLDWNPGAALPPPPPPPLAPAPLAPPG